MATNRKSVSDNLSQHINSLSELTANIAFIRTQPLTIDQSTQYIERLLKQSQSLEVQAKELLKQYVSQITSSRHGNEAQNSSADRPGSARKKRKLRAEVALGSMIQLAGRKRKASPASSASVMDLDTDGDANKEINPDVMMSIEAAQAVRESSPTKRMRMQVDIRPDVETEDITAEVEARLRARRKRGRRLKDDGSLESSKRRRSSGIVDVRDEGRGSKRRKGENRRESGGRRSGDT